MTCMDGWRQETVYYNICSIVTYRTAFVLMLMIVQELIQNADDAQATEVGFLIDWRHHPTDDVMFDNFEKYQGPALYAWNDAVFKKKDWLSLGKINQSSKEEDVLKVGRFGLGFQSVFHITGIAYTSTCNSCKTLIGVHEMHGRYLAAKGFVGKLPATVGVWYVIIE